MIRFLNQDFYQYNTHIASFFLFTVVTKFNDILNQILLIQKLEFFSSLLTAEACINIKKATFWSN